MIFYRPRRSMRLSAWERSCRGAEALDISLGRGMRDYVVAVLGDYPADFHHNGRWWWAVGVVGASTEREACDIYRSLPGSHQHAAGYLAIDSPVAFDVVNAKAAVLPS
jgi:hypothetical protein